MGRPWFWEGNVQDALASALAADGWAVTETALGFGVYFVTEDGTAELVIPHRPIVETS